MTEAIYDSDFFQDKCIHATTTLPIRQNYLYKSDKWMLKSYGERENEISNFFDIV